MRAIWFQKETDGSLICGKKTGSYAGLFVYTVKCAARSRYGGAMYISEKAWSG